MEKPFRPAPLRWLARWILEDLDRGETVLGIPQWNFSAPDPRMALQLLGQDLAAPLGVAAGPHTQLTQNIIAAWLCGAHFIELKTVQVLDQIHVSRPCIDAQDVTYNCEWSQELSLDASFDEYLKAWVLLHVIARRLGRPAPGVMFNMSVGYDLKGIQSEAVQRFIQRMRSAPAEVSAAQAEVGLVWQEAKSLTIPTGMTNHVTLSTMHGCPPCEIEKIACYLIEDLGLNTWVKLNPTLLGPACVRDILNHRSGFDIVVPDTAFEHDPRLEDAIPMICHLRDAAIRAGRSFGIKLSNTLEVVNHRQVFPAHEKMMYMSGRALHPLTVTLAHQLTEALDGSVPISFCGGADAFNFPRLVADGLSPISVCTDLLKPGGYARLQQYLEQLLHAMTQVGAESIDAFRLSMCAESAQDSKQASRRSLEKHAQEVISASQYQRTARPMLPKGSRPLEHYDCIQAPCQEACPAHQDVSAYMRWVASENPEKALDVILCTNPLPATTGRICNHPCTQRCVRNHYDAPLAIREVKRFAADQGRKPTDPTKAADQAPVAVIGAGPAGLSAAYYLRLAGIPVTVFDRRDQAGGMVSRLVPPFRMDTAAMIHDVDRVRSLGVDFQFGRPMTVQQALKGGCLACVVAVGAQAGRRLNIPGQDAPNVLDSLDFLESVRRSSPLSVGPTVLVIGGGNSAMDAARAAKRLAAGSVKIVYRRSRAHMPADLEEINDAILEGVEILDLLAPVEVLRRDDGSARSLRCARMTLGACDSSGRPRPIPVGGAFLDLECDTILVAISQEIDQGCLAGLALDRNRDGTIRVDVHGETSMRDVFAGGDVVHGPSTVIQAIADGRRIAAAIARRCERTLRKQDAPVSASSVAALLERRGRRILPSAELSTTPGEIPSFQAPRPGLTASAAHQEAKRCLECSQVCSLCVTVCPNRANHAYRTPSMNIQAPILVCQDGKLVVDATNDVPVLQSVQVFNITDFCNECGNCATFCPTSGAPYRDKPRLHLDPDAFRTSTEDGFCIRPDGVGFEARVQGELFQVTVSSGSAQVRAPGWTGTWSTKDWTFQAAEAHGQTQEGDLIQTQRAASLLPLIHLASSFSTPMEGMGG